MVIQEQNGKCLLPDNKNLCLSQCFPLDQGRKQQRSCFSELELPVDLLLEDPVEDWPFVSGHVILTNYIYLIKESESGFGIKLDWPVTMSWWQLWVPVAVV